MSYPELLSNFGEISVKEYISEGISHPVFCGNLIYKIRRAKGASNFFSSGTKVVKRIRPGKYDQVYIEDDRPCDGFFFRFFFYKYW